MQRKTVVTSVRCRREEEELDRASVKWAMQSWILSFCRKWLKREEGRYRNTLYAPRPWPPALEENHPTSANARMLSQEKFPDAHVYSYLLFSPRLFLIYVSEPPVNCFTRSIHRNYHLNEACTE